jgi:DNA-binding NarL/FixJ family response regulator
VSGPSEEVPLPHFVVVEDDHLQEGPLADHLAAVFPEAAVETIATEEQFRAHLADMRVAVPDLVVMDVMLRWAFPRPDPTPLPPDVAQGGYYRAGLRCARLMLDDSRLRRVPVVLYTILERSDLERDGQTLPANVTYVGKNSELDVLSRHIRTRLRDRAAPASPRG